MRGFLVTAITIIVFGGTAILLWLREKKHTDEITGELDSYYSILKERRKTIRVNKQLNVICRVIEKPDSRWSAFTFSKDISGEGICLSLPEILPEDAVVNLEFDLPGGKHILAQGKVVWAKEAESPAAGGKRVFTAGVKFVKINNKHKNDLVNFITSSLAVKEQ